MWYIYKENEKVVFSRAEPQTQYFTIDKLPPQPADKYVELKADFEEKRVWWGKRELTEEEQTEERIQTILKELEMLDDKVDRVDEDIIEELHKQTGYVPYTTTIEVINHKEDLRDELKALKKQEVQNESED